MAIRIAIMPFCKDIKDIHVRIMTDNMTAIIYINNMEGIKSKECYQITREIWQWAESNNIYIFLLLIFRAQIMSLQTLVLGSSIVPLNG